MKRYVMTRVARADLLAIWGYIANDNIDVADRVVANIESACADLSDMPGMGHTREDVSDPNVRFWSVYSYLIAYDPNTRPLQIIRIVSGYRNLKSLFK